MRPPVRMQIGPVLHVDDAVGSKVTAMIGRGLPRDYIDVAAALRHYDRNELLRLAFYRDPGLRVVDVAHCMQLLDRLPDAPFADYGLPTTTSVRSGAACRPGRATPSRTKTAGAFTPTSTSSTTPIGHQPGCHSLPHPAAQRAAAGNHRTRAGTAALRAYTAVGGPQAEVPAQPLIEADPAVQQLQRPNGWVDVGAGVPTSLDLSGDGAEESS
jgi:hypothetical protein